MTEPRPISVPAWRPAKSARVGRRTALVATWALFFVFVGEHFLLDVVGVLTASMEPTVIGRETGGDRILMDRLAYAIRDPERFDVAYFRFPQNRAVRYLKRVVGLPGEQIALLDGDLWRIEDDWFGDLEAAIESGKAHRIRKPDSWQEELFSRHPALLPGEARPLDSKTLDRLFEIPSGRPRFDDSRNGGVGFVPAAGAGPDDVVYARFRRAITDYLPDAADLLAGSLGPGAGTGGDQAVGDSAIELAAAFEDSSGSIRLRIDDPRTGARREAEFRLAPTTGRAEVRWRGESDGPTGPWTAGGPAAGREIRLRLEVVDGEARARIDGAFVLRRELERKKDVPRADGGVFFGVSGRTTLRDLKIERDLYWRSVGLSRFLIPPDQFACLGDHSAESADSRQWRSRVVEDPDSGAVHEGDADAMRPGRRRPTGMNPFDRPDGVRVFVDRENREHAFGSKGPFVELGVYATPYVPRSAFGGRAVAVVWPPHRAHWLR